MKKDTHPDGYRKVIFRDNASGERFLFGSVVETTEVAKWEDGKEYPLSQVEISSASHPFYTGKETVIDIAGRVDKFKRRVAIAKDTKSSKSVKKDKVVKKTGEKPDKKSEKKQEEKAEVKL